MTASNFADSHHNTTSSELASSNPTEQHMNTQNSQRKLRRVATAIAALGLVALGTACSGDDLAESMIERQVEAETGENVDFDINDGGINIQTEDGSMTVDENGNMVIQSPEGSTVVNVDDAGNVQIDGVDGEGSMTVDANGNTIINTPDGSMVINADDAGGMQISSEEGDFASSTGSEIPAEFPSDIAIPTGFTVITSSVMGDATSQIVSLTLTSTSSVPDSVTALASSLDAGGYTQESNTTAGDSVFAAYSKGDSQIILTLSLDGAGATVVGISVQGPG